MVCERPPAAFGGSPPHGGENGVNLPLSRKKDRKSFVFDSPSSLLSWGRPTGLAGDTREGETRAKRARGSLTHRLELQLSNTPFRPLQFFRRLQTRTSRILFTRVYF